MTDVCDKCGKAITVGEFPWCPHGHSHSTVIGDDIPGGQLFENGLPEPRVFYSHSEHRAALAANGCEIRAKWAGPGDKYMTRWDSVDLEGAAMLVSRGKLKSAPVEERIPITTADAGTFTYKLER